MTKLSSTVDIAKLTEFIKNQQKIEISDFVYERFNERYLYPIKQLNLNINTDLVLWLFLA